MSAPPLLCCLIWPPPRTSRRRVAILPTGAALNRSGSLRVRMRLVMLRLVGGTHTVGPHLLAALLGDVPLLAVAGRRRVTGRLDAALPPWMDVARSSDSAPLCNSVIRGNRRG